MSQKPPPLQGLTCSTGELAFLLDVTPRRVQQLVAEGVIPKADRGRFDLAAAVRAHCAHQQAALNGALGSMDEREARRRKLAAQAALAELELDRRRGASISQRFFHEFMTAAFARCRAKMLSIPTKMAPVVIHLDSVHEAQAKLTDA